jgi:hypothetical protein
VPRPTLQDQIARQRAARRFLNDPRQEAAYTAHVRMLQQDRAPDEDLARELEAHRRGRGGLNSERVTDLILAYHQVLQEFFDPAPGEFVFDRTTPRAGINVTTNETAVLTVQLDRGPILFYGFAANTTAKDDIDWRVYLNGQLVYGGDPNLTIAPATQPTPDLFTLFPLRQFVRGGSALLEVRATSLTGIAVPGARARVSGWHILRDPMQVGRNQR